MTSAVYSDLEIILILILWSALVLCIYCAGETRYIPRFLEKLTNDIDPDREKVIRCENCKYYNPKVGMCFLHWDTGEDEGLSFTVFPDNYCSFAKEKTEAGEEEPFHDTV